MSESIEELKEVAWEYLDRVISLGEEWYSGLQSDEHLQQLVLALLAGAVIGWFSKSFFSSGKNKVPASSSSKAKNLRTEGGKSKEEVELNARRRL